MFVGCSCDCCSHYAGAIFGAPLPLAALSRCLAVGASIASISFTDPSLSLYNSRSATLTEISVPCLYNGSCIVISVVSKCSDLNYLTQGTLTTPLAFSNIIKYAGG